MIRSLVLAAALAVAPAVGPASPGHPVTPAAAPPQDTTRLFLGEALQRALARHPAVAAARAGREEASAALEETRATRLPRLGLEASLTQYQLPMIVTPLHSFSFQSPPVLDRTLAQGNLALSYTLFDGGGRAARIRLARALEGAAEAALDGAALALTARVAEGYLRVLTVRGVSAAQEAWLSALRAESDRVRRLLAEGRAARVEMLRVDAELARAEAEQIASLARLDVAERDLAGLSQLSIERVRAERLTALRLVDTAVSFDRLDLLARALETSPEVREARRRAEAAAAALGAARATRFPELRVAGAYVDRGSSQGDFTAEWSAAALLAYPLFTGGGRAGAIRRADAEARGLRERLRLAELGAEAGVDRAIAAVREAAARARALETAVQRSEEIARIERLALEVGSGTQTDYLDAEARLLVARASLIEARHAEISARIELARVSGELSAAWLDRALEAGQ